MTIDLVTDFKKHEEALTELLTHQEQTYQKSACKKRLEARYHRLKNSLDMNFNGASSSNSTSNNNNRSVSNSRNHFKSKVSFALVKERAIVRDAIIRQNFRAKPMASVEPLGGTTMEIAENIQDVVNQNLKSTKFKSKAFRIITKDVSDFGASVVYTSWRESNKKSKKTVQTKIGIQRLDVPTVKTNALNKALHILDYFQDPSVADADDSEYQGHIENINLSKLQAAVRQNPEVYIEKNTKEIIERAKKESIHDKSYHDKNIETAITAKKFEIHRKIFYSTCTIKGNEDNDNYYYIEMVAGKIIRFQENPHDSDIRPYSIFTFYPRREYWWGNSDAEFVLPHEKYTNLIMGMKADKALQSLQSYLFYEKGSIDPGDWNNRHKSGGFVGVKGKEGQNLSQLLYQFQPQDTSIDSTSSIMAEVKENQQRLTPRPDLSRSSSQGGLQNTTATAALILDENGDVVEAAILENFAFGLNRMIEIDVIMLQQRLPDKFAIRPKANEDQKVLKKDEILGNVDFHIETALNKNNSSELLRLQNILTSMMNYKGSQDPAFQQLNVSPLVRKVLKRADVGDVDEMMPAGIAQALPGAVPSVAIPGQEQAGAVQSLAPPPVQEGALSEG